ncbi:MAG: cysteine-rich KTR domain-containing protein [Oscillospiraceae bacterium]|nr:cysteine-rich KTR domain-containing protein [Oscillospiraceae bacterium]
MENVTKWLLCPCCDGKTRIKLRQDTVMKSFPLFCPKCRRETLIDECGFKVNVIERGELR